MTRQTFTRYLPHSPEHLFAIVSDVEEYGRFVPLCEGAEVWGCKSVMAGSLFRA